MQFDEADTVPLKAWLISQLEDMCALCLDIGPMCVLADIYTALTPTPMSWEIMSLL